MHRRFPALLVTLSILVAACGGDEGDTGSAADTDGTSAGSTSSTTASASSTSTSTTTSTEPPVDPVPEFVERGPYPVGRRAANIIDAARDRVLPLEILYPAVDDGTGFTRYELIPGLGYDSDTALDAPPVAPPPADSAGWPLLVYSHGSRGFGWVHADLTEHLASHGFVVLAPDHAGNTIIDDFLGTTADGDTIAVDRPLDVSFVITAVAAGLADPLLDLTLVVDTDRIGVVGHSFGAFTALALAGGTGEVDPDARVDAIVALAPATDGLDDDELAAVDVPSLLVSGTADVTTPIEPNTERPYELVAGRPLVRVDIIDAGHLTFSDICRFVELLEEEPAATDEILALANSYAAEACAPELIDVDIAQDIINHAVTGFFLAEIAGDESAEESISQRGIAQVAGDDATYLSR